MKNTILLTLGFAGLLGLQGCDKGPAEEAGEGVDKYNEQTREAKEKVREATRTAPKRSRKPATRCAKPERTSTRTSKTPPTKLKTR